MNIQIHLRRWYDSWYLVSEDGEAYAEENVRHDGGELFGWYTLEATKELKGLPTGHELQQRIHLRAVAHQLGEGRGEGWELRVEGRGLRVAG